MPETNEDIKAILDSAIVPEPSPGFYDEIDEAIAEEPLPRAIKTRVISTRRLWVTSAPAAIAASIVIALLISQTSHTNVPNRVASPTTDTSQQASSSTSAPPTSIQTLLASDVATKAQQVFANVQTLSATVSQSSYNDDGSPTGSPIVAQIRVKANGDFWESRSTGGVNSYVAATDVATECYNSNTCQRFGGIAATDPQNAQYDGSDLPLLSSLRSMATDPSSKLQATTFEGRAAWQLNLTTTYSKAFAIDVKPANTPVVLTIILDQQTFFPLYGKTEVNGKPFDEITFKDLVINPVFGPHDLDAGYGKNIMNLDNTGPGSATPTSLTDVKVKTGYAPLVPAYVPPGFGLSEVSVGSPVPNSPYNQNVVTMTYRRGLESFTITTRSAAPVKQWTDPLDYGEKLDYAPASRDADLNSGSFSGVTAHLVQDRQAVHMWGAGKSLVFTINGDLGSDEMLDVVSSLQSSQS